GGYALPRPSKTQGVPRDVVIMRVLVYGVSFDFRHADSHSCVSRRVAAAHVALARAVNQILESPAGGGRRRAPPADHLSDVAIYTGRITDTRTSEDVIK